MWQMVEIVIQFSTSGALRALHRCATLMQHVCMHSVWRNYPRGMQELSLAV